MTPDDAIPGSTGPSPGWYSDGTADERLRYWDGVAWTEHRQPLAAPVASPVAATPPARSGSTVGISGYRDGNYYRIKIEPEAVTWKSVTNLGRVIVSAGMAIITIGISLFIYRPWGHGYGGSIPRSQIIGASSEQKFGVAEAELTLRTSGESIVFRTTAREARQAIAALGFQHR